MSGERKRVIGLGIKVLCRSIAGVSPISGLAFPYLDIFLPNVFVMAAARLG